MMRTTSFAASYFGYFYRGFPSGATVERARV
jgi:hypothetical protein